MILRRKSVLMNKRKLDVMLFTLGNVTVQKETEIIFPNPSPDPVTANRSQELYDALREQIHIKAWACGRYGQHAYSPELGDQFGKELQDKMEAEPNLVYDYSIQMAGHPIIQHDRPYFIIVDYIPYFDLSILDRVAFPCIKKTYPRNQDFLYREATGIITYTPVQRYMLINWLDIDPCKVTSICSGVKRFVPEHHKKQLTKKILWVGADYERKGGDDVLRAYENLKKIDESYTLTMVGVDRELPSIPGVTVYPFLHGKDLDLLDSLYKEASVFVMPSYKENFGLVYLEAMAHKTPVVVTTRGGFAEVIRRTGAGEVVRPGDVAEICKAIEKIHRTDEFLSYSERAYYFAIHNATWDIATSRMVDAINRWLEGMAVPDDYIDYSMDERFQIYNGIVKTGIK